MVGKCLFVMVLMTGGAIAQNEPSMKDAIASLPTEMQGNINEAQLKDLTNKTQRAFKEKCEKNGGPDAYAKSEKAKTEFKSCIQSLVNYEQLMKEMEAAKPNGTLDEVFKRYCAKTPQFKDCFATMFETSKICLSDDEKKNMKVVNNVTEQLADFICYKEGDRITLFIAESGPECLQAKQEALKECINATFGDNLQINQKDLSASALPTIAFTAKECGQLNKLQLCMVKSLEDCEAPTTANIVESLFKFIREATPCSKFDENTNKMTKDLKSKKNAASTISVTITTALLATTAVLLA